MPIIRITDEDITNWAYGNDPVEPYQDFHMMITSSNTLPLLYKLAEDQNCPKRDFFLHCLYHFSGQTVRMDMVQEGEKELKEFFDRTERSGDPDLTRWMERTKYLFENPGSYSGMYDLWHSWGYINQDEKEKKKN